MTKAQKRVLTVFLSLFLYSQMAKATNKHEPESASRARHVYQQMQLKGERLTSATVFIKAFRGCQKLKAQGWVYYRLAIIALFTQSKNANTQIWD